MATQAVRFPDSTTCARGLGRYSCVELYPALPAAGANVAVDGTVGAFEYSHGITLPFVGLPFRDTAGTMYLTTNPLNSEIRVLMRDLPLGDVAGAQVSVFFDFDRFNAVDGLINGVDKGVVVYLQTGEVRALRPAPVSTGGTSWQAFAGSDGWSAKGTVRRVAVGARFDVELQLTRIAAGNNPAAGGFGIHVQATDKTGKISSFPSELQNGAAPSWWSTGRNASAVRPDNYQTVVTPTAPRGRTINGLTFNAKRFNGFMQTLEDVTPNGNFDTSGIAASKIGALIANYDVVSLQEIWSPAEAAALLGCCQPGSYRARSAALSPDRTARLPQQRRGRVSRDHWQRYRRRHLHLHALPGAAKLGAAIRALQRGRLLASQRRHVGRLGLDYETPENTACWNKPVCNGKLCTPEKCEPRPSGRRFMDVYNTHMQNTEPVFCTALYAGSPLGWLVSPPWATLTSALLANELNCGSNRTEIVRLQMEELRTFVRATQAPDRDALVMGDFNIDGLQLNSPSYASVLSGLELSEPGTPPNDEVHPWTNSLTFDIDHADLAREPSSTWVPGVTTTNITGDGQNQKRIDYVFMMPSAPRALLRRSPSQLLARIPDVPVWQRIEWPGGEQLSDHYPIAFSFRVVDTQWDNKVRPEWPHDVRWEITSTNTSGIGDCFNCGPQDLYGYLQTLITTPAAPTTLTYTSGSIRTPRCADSDSNTRSDACMSDWNAIAAYDPATVRRHRLHFELWDVDDSSGDDKFSLFDPFSTNGAAQFDWSTRRLTQRPENIYTDVPAVQAPGWSDFTVSDYYPVGGCNQTTAPQMCWQLVLKPRSLL